MKVSAFSSSGSRRSVSGVPGWTQPRAGVFSLWKTVPEGVRVRVIRSTAKAVQPSSGSRTASVIRINASF